MYTKEEAAFLYKCCTAFVMLLLLVSAANFITLVIGDWGNVSGTLSAGSWAQVVVGVALFIAQCGVLTKRAELKYLIKRGT